MRPEHISTAWEHLQNKYEELVKEAKADQDIAISVLLFGGTEIAVREFGYAGPNLLIVHGLVDNKDITAYINQSCLQVVFALVPKDSKNPSQPIGFINPSRSDNE